MYSKGIKSGGIQLVRSISILRVFIVGNVRELVDLDDE